MSTETTNKKIKIDNGTTFGRTYTDKAVDEMLKNVGGKLDIVKVTYDTVNSKVTADIANKPDGTYVVDIILKSDDTEINLGTKTGLVEIGSLVDIDSGSTIRTLSGYGYLNNLKFLHGIGSADATTIDITGGTLAYTPASYTPNGLVKTQSNGTFASVGLPDQYDAFLVYDTTVGNYNWRPVSEIDNKTISLFGKHRILVPKDSADTGILSCNASDNGKVLSVVNGEAQWANVGGGSGGEGGISVIELTDKNGTIATAQLDEINANPQNFAFKYNGKILLFTSANSTTYQYCNNTTSSSDNNVMTTSTLLTITSSTGAYTIAENVHNVVANSIHPANGGNLTNIQVGTKVYSIPSGTIIFTHDSTEYTISIPLKEYALGDTITLNEYPLSPKEFFSIISFYAVIDNVIEITGVKFLITYSIFKFGLRTIATCIKSGTVTENKVYQLSYTYATR